MSSTQCTTKASHKVTAALDLDEHSLNYRVEYSPDEALQFSVQVGGYNESPPALAGKLIQSFDLPIPPMQFGMCNGYPNPNNGKPHHKYLLGREGSRVMYVQVHKNYLPDSFNYDLLARTLKSLAQAAGADEYYQDDSFSAYSFVYRIWWD